MVLSTKSAQYKFLQVLTASYVAMMNSMQSANCISNPQVFQDCTDLSRLSQNMPHLPVTSELYPLSSGPATYDYSDYSSVNFYGFNSSDFAKIAPNVTQSATSLLYAACGVNSTCTAAFTKTPNATAVVQALVLTNVNTIRAVLHQSPTLRYYPNRYYGFYSQTFLNTLSAGDELYGMHNGILRCIANGTMNATTYLQQQSLQLMMYGGFQMFESLIHTAAIGSWSYQDNAQSNINITGTQVFTHLTQGGGVDTRAEHPTSSSTFELHRDYKSKWEVWADEASGVVVPNKTEIFEDLKRSAKGKSLAWQRERQGAPEQGVLERGTQTICSSPGDEGPNWLAALNQACQVEGFLSAALSVQGLMSGALKAVAVAGLAPTYAKFVGKFSEVVTGRVVALCAAGVDGFPCYPCSDCWGLADSVNGLVNGLPEATQLVSDIVRDVAEFSNPVGEAIGFADAFCGASGIAQDLYKRATACCGIFCQGPSCQTTSNGCTQGTGVC